MFRLFDVGYVFAGIVYLPVLAYQIIAQRKNRQGWAERFGMVGLPATSGRRIWVHGVSLGEVNAARRLVHSLAERFSGHEIVVSSTTDTGFARGVELFGRGRVFRFPLDFSCVVRRVLDAIGADVIVLMELEVWPNLVREADRKGVPVVVANGRLTERSARRLAMLGGIARTMFRRLAWVGAQDETFAARFRDMGVDESRLAVTGSMKWETASADDGADGADSLAAEMGLNGAAPVWVCGSTGPGEEAMVLDAYRMLTANGSVVRLVLVPRKPERFDEVARLIGQRGFQCRRRSGCVPGSAPGAVDPQTVVLGDTMGELRRFYSSATVVFVGRSLAPMGGSDPMEVAALGKAMVTGPHMDNFREPADVLRRCGAMTTVTSAESLAAEVAAICREPFAARRRGDAGRRVVDANQGATAKTVEAITKLLSGRR
ncbi:MAG: 3-deoxy-D-manno-octulosonic acid transferase [Phycisphaerales bacterium]|nr:3-deoxy-D-manno-octulosonic acid transferase [Phycisphaerales bacterium]